MIAGYACCHCGQEAQVPMRSRCRHVCCWICWVKVFEVSFCILSSLLLSWVLDLVCRHWRAEVIMVVLCNRADHYIFMLWFVILLSSSFFPCLISAATDWMSAILPHMVWPLCEWNVLEIQDAKIRHLGTIAQLCQAISLQLRHISTIRKKTC